MTPRDALQRPLGWLVRKREVPLGWTALLVPVPIVMVIAIGSYTDGVLPWLSSQFSFAWVVLLAITIVAFSGAYGATEPSPPLDAQTFRPPLLRRFGGARLLSLAGLFFCVYLLSVLAWYMGDADSSRLAGELTWWGVPFAVCFWTLGAVEIASETEHSGGGEPADPDRQWKWLVAFRRSRSARVAAYGFLFGGTIGFAVAGSVPGLVWRRAHPDEGPTWSGHGYVTTTVYNFGVTVWAGALLVAATVFLWHAFIARPLGLPSAVLRRAWYSLWAAGALVVLMACFAVAAQGVLAEPLIDLALASYALCFAVMLVEASAATRHRRVRSSLPRRVVGAAVVIGFTFGLAVLVEPPLGFFRTGMLTIALAAVVPLFPTIHRALYGIDRLPLSSLTSLDTSGLESNLLIAPILTGPEEREAVYTIALGSAPDVVVSAEVLSHWRRTLLALADVNLPTLTNAPTRHPLHYLLWTCDDGLERSKKFTPPEEMVFLLELLFEGNLDEQKFALIDLMRRSAALLAETSLDKPGPPKAPSAMEMLEAECIARIPRLPECADEKRRWERLRAMRLAWLTGKIDIWTGSMQHVELAVKQGKVVKGKGGTRAKLLVSGCEAVLGWWLANLEAAIVSSNIDEQHLVFDDQSL